MLKALSNKLSQNASTVIVFVAALLYLGYVNYRNPEKVGDQLGPVLLAAGGVAKVLADIHETKVKATESLIASRDNAVAIQTVKAEVRDTKSEVVNVNLGLAEVHKSVNHKQDMMTAEISELRTTITDERNARGDTNHPSPTPLTDAIKQEDAARPPTDPTPTAEPS